MGINHSKVHAIGLPEMPTLNPGDVVLSEKVSKELLGNSEQASQLAKALHDLLIKQGDEPLARIAWCMYLILGRTCETLEELVEAQDAD